MTRRVSLVAVVSFFVGCAVCWALQSPVACPVSTDGPPGPATDAWAQNTFAALLAAIEREGGRVGSIELSSFDYGGTMVRGYRATLDIKPGDMLVQVPLTAVLSMRTVLTSPIGWLLDQPPIEHRRQALTVFLMWAAVNKPEGVLGLFAQLLDHTAAPGAALWSPPEIAEMATTAQDPTLVPRVAEALREERAEYKALFEGPGGLFAKHAAIFAGSNQQHYSQARFRKFVSLVDSRFWRLALYSHDNKPEPFMVPVADMFNHGKPGASVFELNKFGGRRPPAMVMTASQRFPKGSEVTFYYGEECRAESLVNYGFFSKEQKACKHAS